MNQSRNQAMNRNRKWLSGFIMKWLVIAMLIPALPVHVQAADGGGGAIQYFYVSPEGNDSNPGTEQAPWRTVEKARDEIRTISAGMTGDIIVYLRGGSYYLDDTITFGAADSGRNGYTIRYEAYPGEKPVLSGGTPVTGWVQDSENPNLYKAPLVRDEKLRSMYVNGERAYMTSKSVSSLGSYGTYTVTAGQADWAWQSGSVAAGARFKATDLPVATRNHADIELETTMTWNKVFVGVEELVDLGNGEVAAMLQQPYGAIAQRLKWSAYRPTGSQVVYNVFQWLQSPGQFYFDRAEQTLYYYPRNGQDMSTAEVVAPVLETILNVEGTPITDQIKNISFRGITFAHSVFNLYEVEGSHGVATVQAATVVTAFSNPNWHYDMYRNYDVFPAAVRVNAARDIQIMDGEVALTGAVGVSIENDVERITFSGNSIYETGGAGIVVGHPQHVYENDWNNAEYQTSGNASASLEKYKNGTESVPKDITIQNNFLHKNGSLFAGHAPITTFYTQRLLVEHNFIYDAAYSGMSIGWGWWNFDGSSGSILPGKATQTSRANKIVNNRVEEIIKILHDGGAVYSLGQQGNDDWTDFSEISDNYFNISRTKNVADGSRAVNGIHPDEGSAYIKMERNVITNIIRSVYEIQKFGSKHDLQVKDGFSNTARMLCCAPGTSVTNQYVDEEYIWPIAGYQIVMNAGLENEYLHLVSQEILSDTMRVFPSNLRVGSAGVIPVNGVLSGTDVLWLAPAGTVQFEESSTMTRASGNAQTMSTPAKQGEYKLYIHYANGTVSEASEFTLYIGDQVANVQSGGTYSVSKKTPLTLQLNTNYSYKLNGTTIQNNHQISQEGSYTLEATNTFGLDPVTITFSTFVTEANKLLTGDKYITPGTQIKLAGTLQNPSHSIWILPPVTTVIEEGPQMIRINGDQQYITVPMIPDIYTIAVLDEEGTILSRSDTTLYVVEEALPPDEGRLLWLDASTSVTVDGQGRVSQWADRGGNGLIAAQATAGNQPVLVDDAIKGNDVITFNGTSQHLTFSPLPLNGLNEASIFIVSKSGTTSTGKSASGDSHTPIYFHEAGSWGKVYLNPYQDKVLGRFGTGQSNNSVSYTRPAAKSGMSVTGFIKDGTTEYFYVDGAVVHTVTGKQVPLAGNSTTGWIGMGQAGSVKSYFTGEIAEILIYNKPLLDSDLDYLNRYFQKKYFAHIVSFDSNGGSEVEDQQIINQETVEEPVVPFKDGYTFGGWYLNSALTVPYDFTTPIIADTTLFAKWVVKHTVTFNTYGGTAIDQQLVIDEELAITPEAPTKQGYEFDGWYVDQELTESFDFTTPITADTTLYAKWAINQYIVSFNSNGGSLVDNQWVAYGNAVSEPAPPVRDDHTFAGWFIDSSLTQAYSFATPVADAITLYAKWVANGYTVITFNSNGGTLSDSQIIVHGGTVAVPSAPARAGYLFDGWYSDSALTSSYDFTTPVAGESLMLYAKWTAIMYSVVFNSNGGGQVPDQSILFGQMAVNPEAPTRANYSFEGWYSDTSLTSLFNFDSPITGNLQLYAQWTPVYQEPVYPVIPVEPKVTSTTGFITVPAGSAGEVSAEDAAVTVLIPSGANREELKISIQKLSDTSDWNNTQEVMLSSIFEILKNFNENFNKPVVLTFAIDPESLTSGKAPSVYYYDEEQEHWVRIGGVVNGNHITVETDHFTKFAVFASQSPILSNMNKPVEAFLDVAGHWAEASILKGYEGSIISGFPDGTFMPDRQVTRAEFAVMLMNGLKLDSEGAMLPFTDADEIGSWARAAIEQAVVAGILQGYNDGSLRPNAEISRAEMAVMMARAMKLEMQDGIDTLFADNDVIPAWAKGSVSILHSLHVLNGVGNNSFKPEGIVTRAQAVTAVLNMLEK